jgi:hypothetical protein
MPLSVESYGIMLLPLGQRMSNFDKVIGEFRNNELQVEDWNFVIHCEGETVSAYIMGEGAEQCLAYKCGFSNEAEVSELFKSLGVKRILRGLG